MRERLRIFLFAAIYWLSFHVIIRALFLVYNRALSADLSASEILKVFLNGLKMDASLTGYFLVLTGLVLTASVFTQHRRLFTTFHVLMVLLLLLSAIIVTVDLELYRHWGFRLNTTPLFYAGPEAIGSVDVKVLAILLTTLLALVLFFTFVYWRWIIPAFLYLRPAGFGTAIALFMITCLMFFPIRGSLTVAPMNTGFVYFHKTKAFANHAAINVVWNFMYSLRKSATVTYPETFYDKAKAKQLFATLYPAADSTHKVFNSGKPNIILFILESYTADVIEPLGGLPGVAPNLNRLCGEGILFDNFYSSGDRTDKGIISILSGYPAQPVTSIIKYPAKTQRLPYLNQHLIRLGYNTSMIYGGDIDFANFRSYITNCGFDVITTEDDFPDEINTSKWGVHDHYVLEKAFQQCDTATAPFFKTILTLSSHEPFDVPMRSEFLGPSEREQFLNSCHYTDSAIGKFIEDAKSRPWWKNTVVIFVADHGHRLPGNKQTRDKERFRIPFLIVGGAVKKDSVIHKLGSQTDIANTILGQLDKPVPGFTFSKDLFSPASQSFAVYFYNDGYGFLKPGTYIVHDNTGKQFLESSGATKDDLELSKAYQQILYTDYNKK